MKTLTASLLALGAVSLAACDANDGPVERLGEDIDNVVEPTVEGDSDPVKDAADEIGDAAGAADNAIDSPQ